ncbi:MAG TPA: hypothetical protein GX703_04580 [Erysipelothrix sp.]|nr:hypothetical protein [Erysipelothrix sp.]
MNEKEDIKIFIYDNYSKIATREGQSGCCQGGCYCDIPTKGVLESSTILKKTFQ